MPSLNNAYTWAINTCNRSNVGYSQPYRNQQTVGGITYYDCSSFVWYALKAGGYDVNTAYYTATGSVYTGNAITTHNERAFLLALGFTEVPIASEWKAGDIVLIHSTSRQHTEMVYTGGTAQGITMGAHSANYSLAKQVSINTTPSTASSYQYLFRYGSGGASEDLQWVKGNRYLNQTEMENNAKIIYNYLYSKGWSVNAICGLLGNIQQESTINPGIWQNLTENINNGYGLVQWTPSTKWSNWADANHYAHDNGDAQLKWIDEVTGVSGEWIPTTDYNVSFDQFKITTNSVDWCTKAWLYNFERAGIAHLQNRLDYANAWFTFFQGYTPTPPTPVDPDFPPSIYTHKMPLWFMVKH